MDSHIVRLDPPYNIIFDAKKGFALHIATLIVIDEVKEGRGKNATTRLRTRNYPVVSRNFELEGEAWTDYELKYHHHVCRQGETISLRPLRLFMEYCNGRVNHLETYPMSFSVAMLSYNVKMSLKSIDTQNVVQNYWVELLFDDEEGGENIYTEDYPKYICEGVCEVHSGLGCPFFFDATIVKGNSNSRTLAIEQIVSLREAYLEALKFDGLKSIIFTTENRKYQAFVNKLNLTKRCLNE